MIDPIKLAQDAIKRMDKEDLAVLYVGSVLDLLPSGTYHTPWTCSSEAEADEAWWDIFNIELGKHGAWAETYEGDPLDILVVRK